MFGLSVPLATKITARVNPSDYVIYVTFHGSGGAKIVTLWLDYENAADLVELLAREIAVADHLVEAKEQAAEADPATTTDPNLQRSTQWTK